MIWLLRPRFILIGKKVNEVLTAIITHLTFTSFQIRRQFVLQMNRSKGCVMKSPVFRLLPSCAPCFIIGDQYQYSWSLDLQCAAVLQPVEAEQMDNVSQMWVVVRLSVSHSSSGFTNKPWAPAHQCTLPGKLIYSFPAAHNGKN